MPPEFQTAIAIFQSLGPFGLAAVAVWWLTSQHKLSIKEIADSQKEVVAKLTDAHEKAVDKVSQANKDGVTQLATSLDRIGERLERRDAADREQIKATADVALQLAALRVEMGGVAARLIVVEKAVTK